MTRRTSRQTDAVQFRLVQTDRIVALLFAAFSALVAPRIGTVYALVIGGILLAAFVGIIFYADYRHQATRRA